MWREREGERGGKLVNSFLWSMHITLLELLYPNNYPLPRFKIGFFSHIYIPRTICLTDLGKMQSQCFLLNYKQNDFSLKNINHSLKGHL